ncbi:exotoxin beta-grasp domain-containing protein [Staphylococcus chromogenes]|uniref:exotoxin beta-grasp domain-containing protein n=1 Tax=Staphylococcus chromogenes TaxID=46126 RepID=UPI000D036EE8|nr:hypothetical protein [Staphylococcus chromogenes]
MKLSTIAKMSLALGILTTGIITTHAQSASAAETTSANVQTPTQNESNALNEIKAYYNKSYQELRSVDGFKAKNKDNIIVVKKEGQTTAIKVADKDKHKYNPGNLSNIDVFVVNENQPGKKVVKTTGAITKANSGPYFDYVVSPPISISKTSKDVTSQMDGLPFPIFKEHVSLKELDFKLRKQLMEKHGLYQHGLSQGKIVIKMNSGKAEDVYTFELNKKLQDHRMGDVIDARKIQEIQIEL